FLDSGIANSVRKPVIINRWKNPTGFGPFVVGQALRLPAVIPSATGAVALQTRSRPVTTSIDAAISLSETRSPRRRAQDCGRFLSGAQLLWLGPWFPLEQPCR